MSAGTLLSCDGPPSATAYMLGAMLRGQGRRPAAPVTFPALRLRWAGYETAPRDRAAMRRLTGLGDDARLALLAPHLTGFRAFMALLTHPAMPLPIWRALQVRSRLALHRAATGGDLVLDAEVTGQRTLAKGLELDLRASVHERGELAWEGTTTFYYRGSFLQPGEAPAEPERPPACEGGTLATWPAPSGVGWRMAGLTGDYNPLHYSHRYARSRGFSRAFVHPQLALGQCLARLPAPADRLPLRLDAWVRGQVYSAAEVRLCAEARGDVGVFALQPSDEPRPALVGRVSGGL